MKTNMRREEEYYMGYNVYILNTFGFWLKKDGSLSVRLIIYTLCVTAFVVGSIRQMLESWEDLAVFTDTLGSLLIVTLTAHKAYGLQSNQHHYQELIQTVQNNFYLDQPHELRDRRERQGRILTRIYFGFGFSVAAGLLIYPVVDWLLTSEEVPWKLPLHTSFPVDPQRPEVYGILYFFHFVMASSHGILISSHDSFIILLILHVTGQFQILNINLENFMQQAFKINRSNRPNFIELPLLTGDEKHEVLDDKNTLNGHGTDYRFPQEDDSMLNNDEIKEKLKRAMCENLKCCVHHHLTLIRYVEHLETLINQVLLDQFLSSCLIFCTTAFQMSTMPFEKTLSVLPLMAGALFQLWLYCFFGHQLKHQSERVSTAAYCSLWYEAPEEVKMYVKMIMVRGSHKPALLSIGKFAELSLDTFSAALRASYTYFTLLNEVHDK